MRQIPESLKPILHQLGVPEAMDSLAQELCARACAADEAWQVWLDAPAYLRREREMGTEAALARHKRIAEADWARFERNPLLGLTLAVALVPVAELAEYTGAPALALAAMSGSHVAFLVLEVASA